MIPILGNAAGAGKLGKTAQKIYDDVAGTASHYLGKAKSWWNDSPNLSFSPAGSGDTYGTFRKELGEDIKSGDIERGGETC